MNKYILTYDDCKKLTEFYKNLNFYESTYYIDGYRISTFSYFLLDFTLFDKPLLDESFNAYDVRGITFVFNTDGSLFKRYLMLPKFFNLNQTPSTQYNLVKDKEISSISVKADGSLIAFMKLPNGEIFAKTISGVNNEQSLAAMDIFNNYGYTVKSYISFCIENELTPLFEYVSFQNRVVLKYDDPKLIFIGLRNNVTGEYIPANEVTGNLPFYDICEPTHKTLDELIADSKVLTDIEGWVLVFKDGHMMKVKTDWYMDNHKLRTENIFREDYVIYHYLNATLDDIQSQLDPTKDSDALAFISKVCESADNYMKYICGEVDKLINENFDFDSMDVNKFGTENHKKPFFDLARISLVKPDVYKKELIKYVLKKTYRLNQARSIVEKYKN